MNATFSFTRKSLTAACALACFGFAVSIQAADETPKPKIDKPLSMKDTMFVKKAAKGGMMEVSMGEMAEKEGKSEEVKNLGARLVTDHTKANKELMALAEGKGLKLPPEKTKSDKMAGADFDQKYLAMMLKDHEKDIAEFETASQNSEDADVKSFATKTLPTLKEHLALVKDAQAKAK